MNSNAMWEAWGRTNALYTEWCARAGLNPYRVYVLYALDAHAPITQKGIADYTGLSRQTVATVMRSLKEEGCVSLCTGETDRREKAVRFTEKGAAHAKELLQPLYRLEERVSDLLGAERMKQLSDAITLFNLAFEGQMEQNSDEH